nr:MAG TPA: hypothetical protein [Caudoviricetes sp.]
MRTISWLSGRIKINLEYEGESLLFCCRIRQMGR